MIYLKDRNKKSYYCKVFCVLIHVRYPEIRYSQFGLWFSSCYDEKTFCHYLHSLYFIWNRLNPLHFSNEKLHYNGRKGLNINQWTTWVGYCNHDNSAISHLRVNGGKWTFGSTTSKYICVEMLVGKILYASYLKNISCHGYGPIKKNYVL